MPWNVFMSYGVVETGTFDSSKYLSVRWDFAEKLGIIRGITHTDRLIVRVRGRCWVWLAENKHWALALRRTKMVLALERLPQNRACTARLSFVTN